MKYTLLPLAAACLLSCGGTTVQLARAPVIEYEAREAGRYDSVAHGGFDESLMFGRFEVDKVDACRDMFVDAIMRWSDQQALTPQVIDATTLSAIVHVPTRKPIEYFEFTYLVNLTARDIHVVGSVVDKKGEVLEPKAYVESYKLHDLGTKFREVLRCGRSLSSGSAQP